MKTPDKDYEEINIIKKSKFISIIANINTKEEVNKKINYYKNKYPKANHYTYGYKIGIIEKCSDDKEPHGSAGYQILNNIKSSTLNNTLIIVIRYFGGIKLGLGTLTRAYSNCAKQIINKSNLKELVKGYNIKIKANYQELKELNKIKNKKIKFNKEIIIEFQIKEEELDKYQKYNIIKKEPIFLKI